MARNRVIGAAGQIPWHLPEDFKWFKQITMGGTLLMGRKTFESIGRPLPGRQTVVLSHQPLHWPGVQVIPSLEGSGLDLASETLFLCGGAQLYQAFLPLCSELLLTLVEDTPAGDAFFPPFESLFDAGQEIAVRQGFTIRHYHRLPHLPAAPSIT